MIDASWQGITDLKGIEHFTALTTLYSSFNELTSLDLSANTALTELDCYGNQLESLDVSENTKLTQLYCDNNYIPEAKLPAEPAGVSDSRWETLPQLVKE